MSHDFFQNFKLHFKCNSRNNHELVPVQTQQNLPKFCAILTALAGLDLSSSSEATPCPSLSDPFDPRELCFDECLNTRVHVTGGES